MANKKNINKLKDVFQKQIPSRELNAKIEGLHSGFLRGTINGIIISAYLFTIFYYTTVNQNKTFYFSGIIFITLLILVLTSKLTLPKEIQGRFDGKLLILYLTVAAAATTLAYVLIY